MTATTRSRVESLTVPVSFMTAETVALETPASRATSLMVGRLFFIRRRRGRAGARPVAAGSDEPFGRVANRPELR